VDSFDKKLLYLDTFQYVTDFWKISHMGAREIIEFGGFVFGAEKYF